MARIQILPPNTARLIAAGEVIDRPAALLRELIDNSIDSGASDIRVEIEGGGIASVIVADDGSGMDAEDLALSIQPHATSKIRTADDLLLTRSLGFRGEALASIAAAARLEIASRTADTPEARRLLSSPGSAPVIEATHGQVGTRVLVQGLFDNFPARRLFLKRAQAEASLCRQVFEDKALPHPSIAFRYSSEGRLLDLVPAVSTFRERVLAFHAEIQNELVHEVRFSGEGFEGIVVVAGPAFYRNDRRLMEVFVNRRRVPDWGLLSGLDWAFEGLLPGGTHPFAFLFVEVDPALADFNIHPAKREVRFRDPGSIRHAMSQALHDFLLRLARARPEEAVAAFDESPSLFGSTGRGTSPGGHKATTTYEFAQPSNRDAGVAGAAWETLLRERPLGRIGGIGASAEDEVPAAGAGPGQVRYLGQAFGLFVIVERNDELFLIDQHAAHERLIYDELSKKPPAVQELLVPLPIRVDSEAEEARLEALATAIAEAGFTLEHEGSDWQLTALPAVLRSEPEAAMRELIDGGSADPARSARAMTACKAAIKDGETLDAETALELARRALELPEPRCPHGRPVWVRVTREALMRLVRRIV